MMDNIAYQPGRGNWLVQEDGEGPGATPPRNNDIWDCLDDGADENNLADACVRVITLNDLKAESTGGLFDADGDAYYFSVQHNVTGHGVILKVTGWR
jgi:secreted PhoX family phosphatase